MANTPPNPPPTDSPKKPPASKRPERSQPNNLAWFLIIGLLIMVVVFSLAGRSSTADVIEYSDFKKRLAEDELTAANVHETIVGPVAITFQSQPNPKPGVKPPETKETVKYFQVPVLGMKDTGQADITKLLDKKGIKYGYATQQADWSSVILFSLFLVSLIAFIIFIRRVSGPGAAMSFGRSRGKLYAQEELGITFKDVAGIDEAVEELREVVEFLRTPAKYQALGGRIPRGVLLVGPPGTGKTLLAKAVAGEAGVPFYGLSGSDFVEMFVGVGAARVRDMFQQAGQRSPAIIFIDELDALGKVRGSGMPGGHDEREQTLNALLVEMDGFSSDQSVIVMAATNRPETLDPALMRPGRFDRHVLVDRPDIKGREAILKVHSAKVKMADSVNLKHLAKLTPGLVGADLSNLVNEAALLAARKNKSFVTMDEFEEAVERVIAGSEKQNRIMPEDEKIRVAYHEVGHALVACSLPNSDPVHKVSIIPRGMGALGYTLQRPEEDRQLITKSELESRICVLLGGIAAEDIVYSENSTGGSNDLQRATDLARRMVTEFGMSEKIGRVHHSQSTRSAFLGTTQYSGEGAHSEVTEREIDLEVRQIIDQAYATAHEILLARKDLLERLTQDLLECEVMDANRLNRILDDNKTGPQLMPGTFGRKPKTNAPLARPPILLDNVAST